MQSLFASFFLASSLHSSQLFCVVRCDKPISTIYNVWRSVYSAPPIIRNPRGRRSIPIVSVSMPSLCNIFRIMTMVFAQNKQGKNVAADVSDGSSLRIRIRQNRLPSNLATGGKFFHRSDEIYKILAQHRYKNSIFISARLIPFTTILRIILFSLVILHSIYVPLPFYVQQFGKAIQLLYLP